MTPGSSQARHASLKPPNAGCHAAGSLTDRGQARGPGGSSGLLSHPAGSRTCRQQLCRSVWLPAHCTGSLPRAEEHALPPLQTHMQLHTSRRSCQRSCWLNLVELMHAFLCSRQSETLQNLLVYFCWGQAPTTFVYAALHAAVVQTHLCLRLHEQWCTGQWRTSVPHLHLLLLELVLQLLCLHLCILQFGSQVGNELLLGRAL